MSEELVKRWQEATGAGVKVRNLETEEELAAFCREMELQRAEDLKDYNAERMESVRRARGRE